MKTKLSLKLTALLLALSLCALALASCSFESIFGFKSIFEEGETCTVVVANGEEETAYKVDLGKVEVKEGVFSVIDALKEAGALDYEATDSTYGKFINWIGEAKPAAMNEYVLVMTSVEADFDTSAWAKEIDYRGTKLCTSGLGTSSMTVEAGAIYYFTVDSY